jgi:hypothetical protein
MRRWLATTLLLVVLAAIALALPERQVGADNYRGGGSPGRERSQTDRDAIKPAPRWQPAFPVRSSHAAGTLRG